MKTPLILTATLMILAATAHGADGHFPPPPAVPGTAAPTGPQGPQGPAAQVNCDRPALTKYLYDYRQALREDYAQKVALAIPKLGLQSPVQGSSCIRHAEAFDSAYSGGAEDQFTLTCLAQTNRVFTHIFVLKFKAEPNCISKSRLDTFINGNECRMPNGLRSFTMGMQACIKALENEAASGIAPPFNGPAMGYRIDQAWFNDLLTRKPTVGNIIDQDRSVKVGAPTRVGPNPAPTGNCANPFEPGCSGVSAQ